MNQLVLIAAVSFLCVACSSDKEAETDPAKQVAGQSKDSADEKKEAGTFAAAPDDELLGKFKELMAAVRSDLLINLDALEKANGDCAKAAALLMAADTTPKTLESSEALIAELRKRSHLESRLEATKAEFDKSLSSPELKTRLKIMDEMGAKCSDNSAYIDALRARGYKKAR